MEKIINKVANSGIVSIDIEEFVSKHERVLFDIKPLLFQELILKEKDFRDYIKAHDWSQYKSKVVALDCSADAIVPAWAYMLLTLALQPYAQAVVRGSLVDLENFLLIERLAELDVETYRNCRVVIKGCGEKAIPENAFVYLTRLLQPVAKSIMYGEPCSTVPLYKAKS